MNIGKLQPLINQFKAQGFGKYLLGPNDEKALLSGHYFDLEAAVRVEKFFALLRLTKGEWAGQPFILDEWQRDKIIHPLFGWKRPNGTRRYRKGFIFIPKKNGKSTLAAGISNYLLMADFEVGAEIYCCAADRENARNVFDESKQQLIKSPRLSKQIDSKHIVINGGSGMMEILYRGKLASGRYKVLSSEAASAEGKNIHGLIFDELHTQENRDMWRTLQGGGVARRQPLFLSITTAGKNNKSLCYSEYEYTKKVMAGLVEDDSHFCFIAEADASDDPGDPKTWAKANLGLGVSPKLEALRDIWVKAKDSPEDRNDFLQYHLNRWVGKVASAIPADLWNRGAAPFDESDLEGRPCFGGLDIGATSDLTALVLIFPWDDGTFRVLLKCWCPEDRIKDRGAKKVSYLKWVEDGFMKQTEGNVIDQEVVKADIVELSDRYDIRSLNVDHLYQGVGLAVALNSAGLPVATMKNGMISMAVPTRTMMELVLQGKLRHNGNPVLAWMASNLVMKKDHTGNMCPDKERSHEKIDGMSALVMSIGAHQVGGVDDGRSLSNALKERGLIVLR